MSYDKPKVTIDLAEYNELIKINDRLIEKTLIPFSVDMLVALTKVIRERHEQARFSSQRISDKYLMEDAIQSLADDPLFKHIR